MFDGRVDERADGRSDASTHKRGANQTGGPIFASPIDRAVGHGIAIDSYACGSRPGAGEEAVQGSIAQSIGYNGGAFNPQDGDPGQLSLGPARFDEGDVIRTYTLERALQPLSSAKIDDDCGPRRQRFKEAAERYGYILAGSNNTQNGPVKVVEDAVNALMNDAQSRFSLDPRRTYLAGFSGGARAAVLVGFASQGNVAGIFACGAGFPPDIRPAAPIPFALYLAAGIEDFNFPELRELDRTLEELCVPHELESFSGGHDWPPEEVCTHGVEWFELQAMKAGIRGKDASLIERIYAKRMEEAESLEKEQRLHASLERYAAALRGFAGLRDTAALEIKSKQLEPAEDVRRSRSLEKEAGKRQNTAEKELSILLEDVIAGRDHPFAMQKLRNGFDCLRDDGGRKKDGAGRVAAVRVLSRFRIMLNEEISLAFERREYAPAALRLEVMTQIRPDNPQVYYHLARAYCLGGKKKDAIASLRNAVAKGYRDIAALESNQDLEPLRKNPDYRQIIEDLKRR